MLIEKVAIHLEKQLIYLQKMDEKKRNFITKYETNNNNNKPLTDKQ